MGRVCTSINLFTQTMKDKGYTLRDLERLTKIPHNTIGRWFSGRSYPQNINEFYTVTNKLGILETEACHALNKLYPKRKEIKARRSEEKFYKSWIDEDGTLHISCEVSVDKSILNLLGSDAINPEMIHLAALHETRREIWYSVNKLFCGSNNDDFWIDFGEEGDNKNG